MRQPQAACSQLPLLLLPATARSLEKLPYSEEFQITPEVSGAGEAAGLALCSGVSRYLAAQGVPRPPPPGPLAVF